MFFCFIFVFCLFYFNLSSFCFVLFVYCFVLSCLPILLFILFWLFCLFSRVLKFVVLFVMFLSYLSFSFFCLVLFRFYLFFFFPVRPETCSLRLATCSLRAEYNILATSREILLPPACNSTTSHYEQHVVDNLETWGPPRFYTMNRGERGNGFIMGCPVSGRGSMEKTMLSRYHSAFCPCNHSFLFCLLLLKPFR